MKLITTHTGADFDALSSVVVAQKLYPDAYIYIPPTPEKKVEDYIKSFLTDLRLKSEKEIDFSSVDTLIIVDTKFADRIGAAGQALENEGIRIHLYDHHLPVSGNLTGEIDVYKNYGATTTILLELIKEKNIPFTNQEATLFMLGIYEDTGGFLYPSTSPQDLKIASYLLEKGVDLNKVTKFIRSELNKEQVYLFEKLLLGIKRESWWTIETGITSIVLESYVSDLSLVVQKLRDIVNVDVLFVLVKVKEKVYIVGRSRIEKIDVREILEKFGGGGHPTAASAVVYAKEISGLKRSISNLLKKKIISLKIQEGLDKFPLRIKNILLECGKLAQEEGMNCFTVGGFVRDLLLGKENFDLDIVVEGEGIPFAKKIAHQLNGKITTHPEFLTAHISLPEGIEIDVASARQESYLQPGALPKVKIATIKDDLFRRDFTINAIALFLNPDKFTKFLDYFGGINDLRKGIIRVLHPRSFIDDPTRIIRAIRFEQRFKFKLESKTKHYLNNALREKMLKEISYQRLRDELIIILNEPQPHNALKRMDELQVLKLIYPGLKLNSEIEKNLYKTDDILFHTTLVSEAERWLVYFLVLIDELGLKPRKNIVNKFKFSTKYSKIIIEGKNKANLIIKKLSKQFLQDSQIYFALYKIPLEILIYTMVISSLPQVRKRIYRYLNALSKVSIFINGEVLKNLGFRPGPFYQKILKKVLAAKLNGKVKSYEEEVQFVIDNFGKPC